MMALDLWFREDVTRILASVHVTMQQAQDANGVLDGASEEYGRGFGDAITAIGIAFGVDYPRGRRDWPLEHEPRIEAGPRL